MEQTTVTEHNQKDFYKFLYKQQLDSKESLIDITSCHNPILVDCCGWYYEKIFNCSVTKIECLTNIKQFGLTLNQFDTVIDDCRDNDLVWPTVKIENCTLIFDRSQLLRYQTIDGINNILQHSSEIYSPDRVIVRLNLQFIDDNRFVNRVKNLVNILIPGYVIEKFVYSVHEKIYYSEYRKCR